MVQGVSDKALATLDPAGLVARTDREGEQGIGEKENSVLLISSRFDANCARPRRGAIAGGAGADRKSVV